MAELQLLILVVTFVSFGAANVCNTDLDFVVTGNLNGGQWKVDGKVQGQAKGQGVQKNVDANPWNVTTKVDPGTTSLKITAKASRQTPAPLPGYTVFPRIGAYKYYEESKTWEQAREQCIADGAHLPILNSKEEHDLLLGLFNKAPKQKVSINYFWVGFHSMFEKFKFVTLFDVPIEKSGYSTWTPGEPNDKTGEKERCGSVHTSGGLNDLSCGSTISYFCEQEIPC